MRVATDEFLAGGAAGDEVVDDAGGAVEDGEAVAPALHVEGQVFTHHRQPDQTEITILSHECRILSLT